MDMIFKRLLDVMVIFLVGSTVICAIGTYGTPLFNPYMMAAMGWVIVMMDRFFPSKPKNDQE